MKKKVTFRLWWTVFCKGIGQCFQQIARLLGYKEGTTFGKVIWRICITCFTLLFAMFTIIMLYAFVTELADDIFIRPFTPKKIEVRNDRHLSNHVVFQELYGSYKGRVYDEKLQQVMLEDVDWVVTSADKDSLAVFSKEGKRGYLNRFTGEVVLPAVYTRAWVFSEGLAAVEKDRRLVFIDHAGQVVIDNGFDVHFNCPSYAFHDGYCVVRNAVDGKAGLIDRQGNWALMPEYDAISHEYGLWKVEKERLYGLFSAELDTLYAACNSAIDVGQETIEVRFPDHTAKRFDHAGHVLVDFVIDEVDNLHYATTELHSGESYEDEMCSPVYAVAKCQCYMVLCDNSDPYYGLLDRKGRRITPPIYHSIEAIAEDLYLCQPQGVIIDGSGRVVD